MKATIATICLASIAATAAYAQPAKNTAVDPRDFGFDIPAEPVRAGEGRCVTTLDERGETVVARLHVEVGEHRIVLLPDGRLAARKAAETAITDRTFVPLSPDELAARLTAGEFKGFQVKQAARYLFVYNTSEPFAQLASRILETMLRGVMLSAKAAKLEVREPELPLVVVMFRTEEELQRHRRMPPGMTAYYHVLENRVYLFEQPKEADLEPEFWLRQKLATIAHEGAHQILCNIGVQQRLSVWPMWIVEGLAEYFAPTTTDERLSWKGAGQVNDFRMSELEEYLKTRSPDAADGAMVEQTVTAARLTSAGYASAWALVHLLATARREEFHALLAAASRLQPLEGPGREFGGVVPDNLRLLRDTVGEDPAELERRLILHLKRLPYRDPFADWPHYAAAVSCTSAGKTKRLAAVFRSPAQAAAWRKQQMAALGEAERGTAKEQTQRFDRRADAERFAQQFRQ
jgi:hypothetical protein